MIETLDWKLAEIVAFPVALTDAVVAGHQKSPLIRLADEAHIVSRIDRPVDFRVRFIQLKNCDTRCSRDVHAGHQGVPVWLAADSGNSCVLGEFC